MQSRLIEALADTPAVLIHGPRQCGKTTLVRMVGEAEGYGYVNFDDDETRTSALEDPVGFVNDLPERAVLDEVQRVPELFTSLKVAVDGDREPGRFILTGSTNVLMVPKLADSLAGRMEILRLHPFAQEELERRPSGFCDALFGKGFRTEKRPRLKDELVRKIAAGGYPAALERTSLRRRDAWYRDYVETLVLRDVRDVSRIQSLDVLPRLLTLASGQTARIINVAGLAAPFELTRPTIKEYVTLLSHLFLLEEVPPWYSNRLSRLVKRPKLHMEDTGLACALLGINAEALKADRELLGQMAETFVFQELRRQASRREYPIAFHHFRDRDGVEVDIVLEQQGRHVAGIGVKAGATVRKSDFKGLRKLRDAVDERFVAGVVLYDGEMTVPFGDRLYAVPIRSLWEMR